MISTMMGGDKDASHLDEVDVTASEQMAMVSTITQSTHKDVYKEIPRDYFVTKNQKVNHKYRIDGEEGYAKLKKQLSKR